MKGRSEREKRSDPTLPNAKRKARNTYLAQRQPDILLPTLSHVQTQDLTCIDDERDDGGDDEGGDEEGGDGIPPGPAGVIDEQGRADDADGAEGIGEYVL
jgi:hypothetical protein